LYSWCSLPGDNGFDPLALGEDPDNLKWSFPYHASSPVHRCKHAFLAPPVLVLCSLPGDNGFDPLALGEDPDNLKWYVQAELQNGRWAMLGVAGIMIPEALTKAGILNVPVWYEAGAAETSIPFPTLLAIEFLLFNYVELRRWQDIKVR